MNVIQSFSSQTAFHCTRPAAIFLVAGLLGGAVPGALAQQGEFERAPVFRASQILPPDLVTGPSHRIDESVPNDGVMNLYRINSRFGLFEAQSTAEMKIRVHEVYAIGAMEEVQSSEAFAESVKNAGAGVVEGVGNAVTDPVGTLSGAVSGVGKLFERVGAKLGGDPRSQSEDSGMSDLLGVSKKKRQYAAEFGVDVYSSNEVLQQNLDRLAAAGWFGGLGVNIPVGVVAGPVLMGTQTANRMKGVFRDMSGTDLRLMNKKKLEAMGVSAEVTDLFISNRFFSPRHQTLLVAALEEMGRTEGRGHLVRFAVQTEDEDMALFRQRQAQMYAGYHRSVQPLGHFVPLGKLVAAKTQGGALVFNVPLDHLAWTRDMARFMRWVNQEISAAAGSAEKHVWVTGTVSALARKNLEAKGWNIHERAASLVPDGA
jgi:hypothetical protein